MITFLLKIMLFMEISKCIFMGHSVKLNLTFNLTNGKLDSDTKFDILMLYSLNSCFKIKGGSVVYAFLQPEWLKRV